MFGRSKESSSVVSEFFEKKSKQMQKKKKIFRSKINFALRGEHRHYFSKKDLQTQGKNCRCKVCGILLSEFRVERRIEDWSPNLKPIHKNEQAEKNDENTQILANAG